MVMHKAIDGSVVDALLALETAAETLTEKRAEYDREVIAMEARWARQRAANDQAPSFQEFMQ